MRMLNFSRVFLPILFESSSRLKTVCESFERLSNHYVFYSGVSLPKPRVIVGIEPVYSGRYILVSRGSN